jgi:outer membrane protein assembly factor BamD (BamD/ComL family)
MKWREARSRLSEAIYLVGRHNLRRRAYRGAYSRFEEILEDDPAYPRRDLVYFYLAETWAKADTNNREVDRNNTMRAIEYLERLLAEFADSEKHEEAAERLEGLREELKAE